MSLLTEALGLLLGLPDQLNRSLFFFTTDVAIRVVLKAGRIGLATTAGLVTTTGFVTTGALTTGLVTVTTGLVTGTTGLTGVTTGLTFVKPVPLKPSDAKSDGKLAEAATGAAPDGGARVLP